MSNLVSWSCFEYLHEDRHKAFEDLCRALFRETFCPKGARLSSKPNNPGIEVEPVKGLDGQLISFQAKYFDNQIDYKQIKSSAEKTIKWYAGKIDCVYLYCNKPINSNCKSFVTIQKSLQENGILIVPITEEEILDEVTQYPSIMSYYFGKHNFSKDWFNMNIETAIKNLGSRYNMKFNIPTHIQEKVELFLGYKGAITRINDRKNKINEKIDYVSYSSKRNETIDFILQKIHSFPDVSFTNLLDCFSWSETIENDFSVEFDKAEKRVAEIQGILWENTVDKDTKEKLYYEKNDLEKILQIKKNISISDEEKQLISNNVMIILGDAGTGKSQLLANLAENCKKDSRETLLFIGQTFLNSNTIQEQICSELQLEIKEWKSLLEAMEEIGKRDNRYVLFAIDALNESKDVGIWRNGLVRFIKDFNDYKHIKLICSIRNGYENNILNESVQSNIDKGEICRLEHYGFADESVDAIYAFLNANNIPCSPEYYLQHEMYNPLFLTLFCKVYSGNGDNFADLVEKIIDKADDEAKDSIGIFHEYPIAKELLKEWCDYRITTGSYYISEEGLLKFAVWDTFGIQQQKLNYLSALDKFGLVTKLNSKNVSGWFIGYEKIGQYLVSKRIIENSINKDDAKQRIMNVLGISNDNTSNHVDAGLFEMLSVCYAKKYHDECVDIVDEVKEDFSKGVMLEAYYKGVSIRNKDDFSYNTFIKIANKYGISCDTFVSIFIENAMKVEHPLNALSLHCILYDMKLCVRDAEWTTRINCLSEGDRIYNLISYYERSTEACKLLPQKQIKLLLVLCMWMLTSSNVTFRNKVSRAVIGILSEHFEQSLYLLEMLSDVNDPYIVQRLYACIFGAIMRGNKLNSATLIAVAKIVYEKIFNQKYVYADILVRDYARLIIERVVYMHPTEIEFDLSKIYPPYNSRRITNVDKKFIKELMQRKDKTFVSYAIVHSMAFDMANSGYGDFGRYVFQRALQNFEGLDYNDKNYEKRLVNIHDYALKMIFNDFGYDDKLFESHDRRSNVSFGRSGGKIERIGKKYQWLAMYNILARVSDVRKLKGGDFDDTPVKYEGAWQLGIRNFDPTVNVLRKGETLIPEFAKDRDQYKEDFTGFDETQESSEKWSTMSCNFVKRTISKCTKTDTNGITWVSLGAYDIQKNKPNEISGLAQMGEQHIWTITRSFFVKNCDIEKVKNATIETIEKIYKRLEYTKSYELYGREYAWSEGYKHEFEDKKNVYYLENIESVIPTTMEYVWEREHIDVEDGFISFSMPCGNFINCFGLEQKNTDGYYYDKDTLVAYDSKHNGTEVLVKADYMNKYLQDNELTLGWCLLTEKQYFYGISGQNFGRWLGLYVYEEEDKVVQEKLVLVDSNKISKQRETRNKENPFSSFLTTDEM